MIHDITQVVPGFTDPKKQPMILKQLSDYAKSMGYKEDEIKDIRDRRHLLMVYKAMMYDHVIQDRVRKGQ